MLYGRCCINTKDIDYQILPVVSNVLKEFHHRLSEKILCSVKIGIKYFALQDNTVTLQNHTVAGKGYPAGSVFKFRQSPLSAEYGFSGQGDEGYSVRLPRHYPVRQWFAG
jgi:hypothetical protein